MLENGVDISGEMAELTRKYRKSSSTECVPNLQKVVMLHCSWLIHKILIIQCNAYTNPMVGPKCYIAYIFITNKIFLCSKLDCLPGLIGWSCVKYSELSKKIYGNEWEYGKTGYSLGPRSGFPY